MAKEVFENLQRQIEDHLAAMPREKTRFPDKNVDMLQYVESELKSLLTQPADVQERARTYVDNECKNAKHMMFPDAGDLLNAYLAGASYVGGMQWVKASEVKLEDQKCYHLKISTIPELALGGRYFEERNQFFCSALAGNWADTLGTLVLVEPSPSSMQEELQQLRDWKESAMRVMNEIDLQECGNVLGVPLGQSISTEILPGLKKMRDALEKIIDLYPNNDRDGRPVIALNDIRQTAFNALNP